MINRTIGPYHILESLGEGGMGKVYKAFDSKLKRTVALKFLSEGGAAEREARNRFPFEAQAAAAIRHANICPVHAIERIDGFDFIVMAFIEGRGLDQLISRGALPIRQAVDIARQIASGLEEAHAGGVIHRDIKPSNILLSETSNGKPQAILVDFGLAQFGGKPKITRVGYLAGTYAYMSPEQAAGRQIDHRSDLWSLGCVLYEMVTGAAPFEAHQDHALLSSIQHTKPQPLHIRRPGVPPGLETIVGRCLAKDREQRYQQAGELAGDLERLAARLDSGAAAVENSLPAPAARGPRWRLRAGLFASILAAVAALVAYSGLDRPRADDEQRTTLQSRVLTRHLGIERYPHLSPTAESVAFAWTGPNGGDYDIYVQSVKGSQPAALTDDPAADIEPRWSPAGDRIAFQRRTAEPDSRERFRIVAVPAVGGVERVLFEAEERGCEGVARFDWAPDGRSLAVAYSRSPGEPCSLVLVDLDSGRVEPLTSPEPGGLGDCCPAFSPDGSSLAFLRLSAFLRGDVHVLDLAGAPRRLLRLTDDGSWRDRPTWDRDGRWLYALAIGDRPGAVWRLSIDGEAPAFGFELPLGEYPHFTMARDNSLVVFPVETMRSDLIELEPTPGGGALQEVGRIFPSSAFDAAPHFSPQGDRVIFVSTRSDDSGSFWIGSTASGVATPLDATDGFHAGSPRWSPDGGRIAFDAAVDGDWNIYVVDLVSKIVLPITTEPGEDVMPEWTPDGGAVYFSSNRSGRFEVWRRTLGEDALTQITHNGGLRPRFGDSESELFYVRDRSDYSSVWISDAWGHSERRLVDFVVNRNFEAWGGSLYFVSTDRQLGATPVDWLGAIDYRKRPAPPRRLYDYPPETRAGLGLTIHPETGRVVVSTMVQRQADLMIAASPVISP